MRTRMRAAAAPLVLMAALVAGCGGDDGDSGGGGGEASSSEVTTEDFCSSYAGVEETTEFDDTKKALTDMADQGLPEDAPADAKEGFDVLAKIAEDAGDEDEANKLGQEVDADGQEKVTAFFEYASTTCAEEESPSGDEESSDEPTE